MCKRKIQKKTKSCYIYTKLSVVCVMRADFFYDEFSFHVVRFFFVLFFCEIFYFTLKPAFIFARRGVDDFDNDVFSGEN